MTDAEMLDIALAEAEAGACEGGIPIGAALFLDGVCIARGRNQRVQQGSQILHGEMACLANAGRRGDFHKTVLATTLSPCMMCSGTIVQFSIPRVIIGENRTFGGNEDFLRTRGIDVSVLDDPRCVALMRRFIAENPALWNEDIGVPD
jgi:cytosine deaminase